MKFQRFNESDILEAIKASIEGGPCYRGTECTYANGEGGHCVVGWLLAHEGKTPEEVWECIDALGMSAIKALIESEVYAAHAASKDEKRLAVVLQCTHDALAYLDRKGRFTRAEAVTKYCQALERVDLYRLSARLRAMFEGVSS